MRQKVPRGSVAEAAQPTPAWSFSIGRKAYKRMRRVPGWVTAKVARFGTEFELEGVSALRDWDVVQLADHAPFWRLHIGGYRAKFSLVGGSLVIADFGSKEQFDRGRVTKGPSYLGMLAAWGRRLGLVAG